jgi:hypothetical protein
MRKIEMLEAFVWCGITKNTFRAMNFTRKTFQDTSKSHEKHSTSFQTEMLVLVEM